jgi:hypothetical protein
MCPEYFVTYVSGSTQGLWNRKAFLLEFGALLAQWRTLGHAWLRAWNQQTQLNS